MTANQDPTVVTLLAGLATLAEAARRTGAPDTAIATLDRSAERIRYLAEVSSRPGDETVPIQAPTRPGELPGALSALIEAGAEAGAPAWAANLLITTHTRLSSELTGTDETADKRLAVRLEEDLEARLVRADGNVLTVRVVDRSPLGLGLFAEQPLDPHELVRLDIQGPGRGEHQGEIVFCLERRGTFHIGIELLASASPSPGPVPSG